MEQKKSYITNEINLSSEYLKKLWDNLQHIEEPPEPVDNASEDELKYNFITSILYDLQSLDYTFRKKASANQIKVNYPNINNRSNIDVKKQIQKHHQQMRNDQLTQPSNIVFVEKMEKVRLFKNEWVSIINLMRDGEKFAEELETFQNLNELNRITALNDKIKPYIQFVEHGIRCEQTGIKLSDIWRYFRHTWSLEYKSIPGRNFSILIRDSGSKFHPIIGITALGSSAANHGIRDAWAGWTDSDKVLKHPKKKILDWMDKIVNRNLEYIYILDIIKDKLVSNKEISNPTNELIAKLDEKAKELMVVYRSKPPKTNKTDSDYLGKNENWWKENWTLKDLYKSKRCTALASILRIRLDIQQYKQTKKESYFKDAILRTLKLVKSEKMGINILDIIVCGAIAPYNHILGGKLVSLLMTSPEIATHYNKLYDKESFIASGMKGGKVKRSPELACLFTTSLYPTGSSQYNRIKVPLNKLGYKIDNKIEYHKIGISKGFGIWHISHTSREHAKLLLDKVHPNYANSIFGEGSSPLVRKLIEACRIVGFTKYVLEHHSPRISYGISLVKNLNEYLTGFEDEPKFIFRQTSGKQITEKLSKYWISRWVSNRILSKDVLSAMNKHDHSYPITHGGRVRLPDNDKQLEFWENNYELQ